ncbi:MAG: GAF domain-containing protein, partial [Verrucomicrobiaceae bacterium]
LWSWKWVLAGSFLLPPGVLYLAGDRFLDLRLVDEGDYQIRFLSFGKIWLVAMLMLTLAVLVNLEKTFRASVGMSRWRIKYLFVGVGMIFGVKIYTLSQMLLFASYNPALSSLAASGMILGCLMIGIGHFRSSFGDFDLYPSRAVLQGSLVVMLTGGYFLIVGLLAQVVKLFGAKGNFPAQALVVLLGIVGLAMIALSDRFQAGLRRFVSRHFRRAEHDFRRIWTDLSHRTSSVLDPETLGQHATGVISENFDVLGVTVLGARDDASALTRLASTEQQTGGEEVLLSSEEKADLVSLARPFNLELQKGEWASILRESCPRKFGHGGDRWAVPLIAADRLIGLVVLVDRVNGVPYTHEELDLLNCIGDQLASSLLNCSLNEEIVRTREIEAFQTLSTFFVHDLKNAANSLNRSLPLR